MYTPLQQTIKYLSLSTKSHALCPHNPVCLHPKPHIQSKVGIKTYLMSKIKTKNQNDFVLRH